MDSLTGRRNTPRNCGVGSVATIDQDLAASLPFPDGYTPGVCYASLKIKYMLLPSQGVVDCIFRAT